MLEPGPAKKITVYINEDRRHHGSPLYEAVLYYLMRHGVAGATAEKAMAGYGSHHLMHTGKIEFLAEHLPVRIEFIESASKLEEVLPGLRELVVDGLIEVQDTTVIRISPGVLP